MSDPRTDLAALDPRDLHEWVAAVLTARWAGEWTVDLPPPSPDGSADVVAEAGDAHRLVRVHPRGEANPLGAPAVEGTARLVERGFERATLVSTGGFAPAAEAVDAPDVELVDSERLVAWADEAGVASPTAPADAAASGDSLPPAPASVLDRYGAYWPEGLVDRARAVVAAVDDAAPFAYHVSEGSASTEVECRLEGAVPVRVRFTATSLLVLVRSSGGYERALALTVHRKNRPKAATLVERVRSAVGSVLDDEK